MKNNFRAFQHTAKILGSILVYIVASSLIFLVATAALAKDQFEPYVMQSKKVLEAIDKDGSSAAISYESEVLMNMGKVMATEYGAMNNECQSYLAMAVDGIADLDSLDLNEIETKYHLDGALPKAPEKCHHMKDLVIHPATVILLVEHLDTIEGRLQMKAEILEVLAHLREIKKS